MAHISQNFHGVQKSELLLVEALWKDAQSNADLLGIKNYTWDILEEDLNSNTTSYSISCDHYEDSYSKRTLRWNILKQEYDAVGPHTYHGCVEIAVGLRAATTEESKNAFMQLCFASYYRRIAEFYPDFTTRYIDSPKGVI